MRECMNSSTEVEKKMMKKNPTQIKIDLYSEIASTYKQN